MIAAPPTMKQPSTMVAAIDAAFIWKDFPFEIGIAEVVADGSIVELDAEETEMVDVAVVRIADEAFTSGLLVDVIEVESVVEDSSTVFDEVVKRPKGGSSLVGVEPSVDSV